MESALFLMDAWQVLIDRCLIRPYRLMADPVAAYFTGTFIIAMLSVLVGEASVLILRKVNSFHMQRLDSELTDRHERSLQAKLAGDDESYRQLNREANDAFGRVFFNMFTFSAASLWAAFLALAWMQTRFRGIEFPLPLSVPGLGDSTGYVLTFFLLYVLSRILMSNLKRALSPQPKAH